MLRNIWIKLDLPEGKHLADASDEELALAINAEIGVFEMWFRAQSNEPLVGFERSLLRTFLAWKLKYEDTSDMPSEEDES